MTRQQLLTGFSNVVHSRVIPELRRIRSQGRRLLMSMRLSEQWQEHSTGLRSRAYDNYETYRKHQALKLDAHRGKSIRRHDARFFSSLGDRLPGKHRKLAGARVLCLAARQGSEVRAFIAKGAFAVGIDLNPGRDNHYVMVGDFHALQFADESIDIVYTNSLDHAFDLDRILSEVTRVLVDDGLMICEAGPGGDAGSGSGFYESFVWEKVDDLLNRIRATGFELIDRTSFDVPWNGEQLVLRKVSSPLVVEDRERSPRRQ